MSTNTTPPPTHRILDDVAAGALRLGRRSGADHGISERGRGLPFPFGPLPTGRLFAALSKRYGAGAGCLVLIGLLIGYWAIATWTWSRFMVGLLGAQPLDGLLALIPFALGLFLFGQAIGRLALIGAAVMVLLAIPTLGWLDLRLDPAHLFAYGLFCLVFGTRWSRSVKNA
jgi:hypothetical protein